LNLSQNAQKLAYTNVELKNWHPWPPLKGGEGHGRGRGNDRERSREAGRWTATNIARPTH